MKLNRKQVREALDQIPVDVVLLGTDGARESTLTASEREFARQLALGESKASAYRKSRPPSRPSRGTPETQSRRGQELAKRSAVQAQVEAFKAAFEAAKYATPASLRALVIHQLTQHALNDDCPPAQRIKSLELLGKITEVALFTERREVVQVADSGQLRDRLMNTLRTITAQAVDVTDTSADSLLAELAGSAGDDAQAAADDEHLPGDELLGPGPELEAADTGRAENNSQLDDPTHPPPPSPVARERSPLA